MGASPGNYLINKNFLDHCWGHGLPTSLRLPLEVGCCTLAASDVPGYQRYIYTWYCFSRLNIEVDILVSKQIHGDFKFLSRPWFEACTCGRWSHKPRSSFFFMVMVSLLPAQHRFCYLPVVSWWTAAFCWFNCFILTIYSNDSFIDRW